MAKVEARITTNHPEQSGLTHGNIMSDKNSFKTQFRFMMSVILHVHNFPYASAEEIVNACNVSKASYYRTLHYVKIYGVSIEFKKTKLKSGYKITNYGVFNIKKLNSLYDEGLNNA